MADDNEKRQEVVLTLDDDYALTLSDLEVLFDASLRKPDGGMSHRSVIAHLVAMGDANERVAHVSAWRNMATILQWMAQTYDVAAPARGWPQWTGGTPLLEPADDGEAPDGT